MSTIRDRLTLFRPGTGKSRRNCRGSFVTETPVVLFVLFICFVIPLIILASVTMRSTSLGTAAKAAAHAAAKAKTFEDSSTSPSATQIATNTVTQVLGGSGITLNAPVITRILITNVASQATTSQTTKLSQAPDASANVYQIEVEVTGQIEPLVRFNIGLFGNVPGLTGPFVLTSKAREMVENPQALLQ